MAIRSLLRAKTVKGFATDRTAPIYVDSDDNLTKVIPAGSGTTEVQLLDTSAVAQSLASKALTLGVTVGPAPVAQGAGTSLAIYPATHAGKVVYITDTDGITITLPAATGTGNRYRFVQGATVASNQTRFNVTGTDSMAGVVRIHDEDTAAVSGFRASGDADQMDLNGTTKGGLAGDYVEFIDIASAKWWVHGQLSCPAGSNPATPFATGQVS